MAEIPIERKERSSLPWVLLGVAVLALLLWFLFGRDRGDVTVADGAVAGDVVETPVAAAPMGLPQEVESFVQYAQAAQDRPAADISHDYTADGIRQLAAALGAVATRDTVGGAALQPRVDALREQADALGADPQATDHASITRAAFTEAASIMGAMQEQRFPNLDAEVGAVREAAEGVRGEAPLVEQTAQVQTFFDRAATALQSMATG